ncbi:MAG: FecR domain-containing protein, partial [Pseudomonadales bacterium]|nr:FecR domain-containing protein [Pseudomonadales bacterium]
MLFRRACCFINRLINRILITAFVFLGSATLHAQQSTSIAARVVDVEGEAWYTAAANDSARTAVTKDLQVEAGGTIITGKRGKVALLLADESLVRLHHNSEFTLRTAAPTAGWLQNISSQLKSSYELLRGEMWFRNKRRQADIEIDTAHVSISVRGTEFSVVAKADVVTVTMLEGRIQARNEYGSVDASSGEQVVALRGQPPRKSILLTPDDAVQWTIKLPALFDASSFAAACMQEADDRVREQLQHAAALASAGDYDNAIAALGTSPGSDLGATGNNANPALATYRNWLLLENGDASAASAANVEQLTQDAQ